MNRVGLVCTLWTLSPAFLQGSLPAGTWGAVSPGRSVYLCLWTCHLYSINGPRGSLRAAVDGTTRHIIQFPFSVHVVSCGWCHLGQEVLTHSSSPEWVLPNTGQCGVHSGVPDVNVPQHSPPVTHTSRVACS